MKWRKQAAVCLATAMVISLSAVRPVFAGTWTVREEDGAKIYEDLELDLRLTVPSRYVASELTGTIEEQAGNARLAFAVADHPVDMESNVTVIAGFCKIGETKMQGNALQIAQKYGLLLVGPLGCTLETPLAETEIGGHLWQRLYVREPGVLFLHPMNLDFYLREQDDTLIILAFAYYDEYEEEVQGIRDSWGPCQPLTPPPPNE